MSSSNNSLPTWTSDSHCTHHGGGSSLSFRVGLTHEQCLLFEPADFTLQGITCLVGTNGSGKTSLARVISQLPGFPSDLLVEYVSTEEGNLNESELTPAQHLRGVVEKKLKGLTNQIDMLENENDDIDDVDAIEETANKLAELYEQQEELMESFEQEMEQSLNDLGFQEHGNKTLAQLSSGWRYKCRLVAAFLLKADLLIIDEPSFLDAASTQWLVDKLQQASSTVLFISHKETLLETLADKILYINSENKTLTTYNCGYTEFRATLEAQRAHAHKSTAHAAKQQQQAQSSLQSIQKDLRRRQGNLKAITTQNSDQRFIKGKNKEAKQKADRSAASKVKLLQKQTAAIEELSKQAQKELVKPLRIDGSVSADVLATMEQVSFSYDTRDPPLFSYVDAQVGPTDRILLRGPNGCGKTTLVRLLLGELEPTEGKLIRQGKVLYFPQTAMSDLMHQHGKKSAIEYLGCDRLLTETQARHHLGNFGLTRNVVLRPIASLSAGQRVRMWLAAQVLKHPNPCLLILDEISENVDVETRDSLIELLHSFDGAVLVISHDPDFCGSFGPTQIWTLNFQRLRIGFGDE